MSNIPFNTVASVLTTTGVHRQSAASAAKVNQDDKQVQQVFKLQTARHTEEVQDLSDGAVDAIGEEPDKHNEQQRSRKRKQEEAASGRDLVDIAQLSEAATAQAPAAKPKMPPAPPPSSLDISA